MKNIDWNNVEAVEGFKRIEAGGYICGITAVEDVESKEYLKLEFDIIDGEFKDYYRDLYERKGFWGGNFIRSYKESARGFFKKFLNAVEASNPNYRFNNDEKTLRSKNVGLVLGYEEYVANSGEVKERIYVADILPIQDITTKNYVVPKLKKLQGDDAPNYFSQPAAAYASYNSSEFEEIVDDDDDLPF